MPDTRPGYRSTSRRAGRREPCSGHAAAHTGKTEEEAAERKAAYEEQRKACEAEQARQAEERRQRMEQEEKEEEAAAERLAEVRRKREAMFERIVENAPATLSAAHLRVLLRAIVQLDPYTFADDLAEEMADDNDRRSAEEVLLTAIDGTADDKLTGFAVRLALFGHRGIPHENEPDFLTEAGKAFAKPKSQKNAAAKQRSPPS